MYQELCLFQKTHKMTDIDQVKQPLFHSLGNYDIPNTEGADEQNSNGLRKRNEHL